MKNSRLIYWQIFMADSYCYYYYIIIIVTAANYNATLMLTLGMIKHQTGIAIVLNDTISKWHKCYSCAKALSSNVFGLDFFKCMPTIITWVFFVWLQWISFSTNQMTKQENSAVAEKTDMPIGYCTCKASHCKS